MVIAWQRSEVEMIDGKNTWEFVTDWYKVDAVFRYLNEQGCPVPTDIRSREFAEWLTEQYRLAMARGIDLGQESKGPPCKHVWRLGRNDMPLVVFNGTNAYIQCQLCGHKERA